MTSHIRSACLLAAIGVGAVLAGHTGLLATAWAEETTITRVLVLTIIAWSAWCFAASLHSPRWIKHGIVVGPALGLLGASLGIAQELSAITNDAGVVALIPKLGIAVHATVAGIGSSIILYGQKIALEHDR